MNFLNNFTLRCFSLNVILVLAAVQEDKHSHVLSKQDIAEFINTANLRKWNENLEYESILDDLYFGSTSLNNIINDYFEDERSNPPITKAYNGEPSAKRRKTSFVAYSESDEIKPFSFCADCKTKHATSFNCKTQHYTSLPVPEKEEKIFTLQDYAFNFKSNGSAFIQKFCTSSEISELKIKLPLVDKKINEHFEAFESRLKSLPKKWLHMLRPDIKSHAQDAEALDFFRTKQIYYLLTYSLYEPSLMTIPDSQKEIDEILLHIILFVRLKIHSNNAEVKRLMALNLFYFSNCNANHAACDETLEDSLPKFNYVDFTKILDHSKDLEKKELLQKNSDLMKRIIYNNIQKIIEREFENNFLYNDLCHRFNNGALEINNNRFFERLNSIIRNSSTNLTGCKSFKFSNIFPVDIFVGLMNENFYKEIKSLPNIKLKTVITLIYIVKICLNDTGNRCTLLEYFILLVSLQKEFGEYKKGDKISYDSQSLVSYLFSLNYLNSPQKRRSNDIGRSMKILRKVFPKYKILFPDLDAHFDRLRNKAVTV